ncbi:hypothetical protein LXL04_035467 [Taraxacum kok-saghyz]
MPNGWSHSTGTGGYTQSEADVRRSSDEEPNFIRLPKGRQSSTRAHWTPSTKILKNEGAKSLFKGDGANILRAIAGAGVLSGYDKLQLIVFGKKRRLIPCFFLPQLDGDERLLLVFEGFFCFAIITQFFWETVKWIFMLMKWRPVYDSRSRYFIFHLLLFINSTYLNIIPINNCNFDEDLWYLIVGYNIESFVCQLFAKMLH